MKIGDFIKIIFPFLSKTKKLEEGKLINEEEIRKDEIYREECEREHRIESYIKYIGHKENFQNDLKRYEQYLQNNIDDPARWRYAIYRTKRMLQFLRPSNPKDIAERENVEKSFVQLFRKYMSPNSNLRFHLTTIYAAEDIIKSGGIYSSIDIHGYCAGTNPSGQISVSKAKDIGKVSMQFYADTKAYHYTLPCGCVFALRPRTELDEKLKNASAMEAVNFKKHPEQLYAILTTTENIPLVKTWLKEGGLNPELAYTFDKFLGKLKREQQLTPNGVDRNRTFRDRVANQTKTIPVIKQRTAPERADEENAKLTTGEEETEKLHDIA